MFFLKLVFPSFNVLKKAVKIYSIRNRLGIEFKKNDKLIVQADYVEGYQWEMTARKLKSRPRCQLKKLFE